MPDATNTLTLAGLQAEHDAQEHSHAVTAPGMNHIHNHATGDVVWYPTWQKARETTDWETAFTAHREQLAAGEATAVQLLDRRTAAAVDEASRAGNVNEFLRDNLARILTDIWALGDAYAQQETGSLADGGTSGLFASYAFDVYGLDGSRFGADLWNTLVAARKNRIAEEEAARKALKPMSKKARKVAERKAAGKR